MQAPKMNQFFQVCGTSKFRSIDIINGMRVEPALSENMFTESVSIYKPKESAKFQEKYLLPYWSSLTGKLSLH